jgi:hypothetical protein
MENPLSEDYPCITAERSICECCRIPIRNDSDFRKSDGIFRPYFVNDRSNIWVLNPYVLFCIELNMIKMSIYPIRNRRTNEKQNNVDDNSESDG